MSPVIQIAEVLARSAHARACTKAPAFTLPDQDGEPVMLSDLKVKRVVLHFYPKANPPG